MFVVRSTVDGFDRLRVRGRLLVDVDQGPVYYSHGREQSELVELLPSTQRGCSFLVEGDGYLWTPEAATAHATWVGESTRFDFEVLERGRTPAAVLSQDPWYLLDVPAGTKVQGAWIDTTEYLRWSFGLGIFPAAAVCTTRLHWADSGLHILAVQDFAAMNTSKSLFFSEGAVLTERVRLEFENQDAASIRINWAQLYLRGQA